MLAACLRKSFKAESSSPMRRLIDAAVIKFDEMERDKSRACKRVHSTLSSACLASEGRPKRISAEASANPWLGCMERISERLRLMGAGFGFML